MLLLNRRDIFLPSSVHSVTPLEVSIVEPPTLPLMYSGIILKHRGHLLKHTSPYTFLKQVLCAYGPPHYHLCINKTRPS